MPESTPKPEIHERVLEGLAKVRGRGKVNMLDVEGVADQLYLLGYPDASTWYRDNPELRIDALNAMAVKYLR